MQTKTLTANMKTLPLFCSQTQRSFLRVSISISSSRRLVLILSCLAMPHWLPAPIFEELYSFPLGPARPCASLVQGADGAFYGTTTSGGPQDAGTVFRVMTNGVLEIIASFNGDSGAPHAGLSLGHAGAFYGTTTYGGAHGKGIVFRVTTNGTLTTLASLEYGASSGGGYQEGLTLAGDGAFYGTTPGGGSNDSGSVFRVSTDGRLTTLASFAKTNGVWPVGRLTLAPDGALYGVTAYTFTEGYSTGGPSTIFRVTTNGILTPLANSYTHASDLTVGSDGALYGTDSIYPNGVIFRVTTEGIYSPFVWFDGTNGAGPGGLVLGTDGALYGTSGAGGANNRGTLFRVTTNGVLSTVRSFASADGAGSRVGLVIGIEGNFYGITADGGGGNGTIYRVAPDGGFQLLAVFTDPNGSCPHAGLVVGNDGVFYGTTTSGGSHGLGTVFRVATHGGLTLLASFDGANGRQPEACLVLAGDDSLYGTTYRGGAYDHGTVFRCTTDGTITTVGTFDGTNGANPYAGLTLGSDGAFWGTTFTGGASNKGTVFHIFTNGAVESLASFAGSNGAYPCGRLKLVTNGYFYGTTFAGGASNLGTICRISTNGALESLSSFLGGNSANPGAGLVLDGDGILHGTTYGINIPSGGLFAAGQDGTVTASVSLNATGGNRPEAELVLGADGALYGTTSFERSINLPTSLPIPPILPPTTGLGPTGPPVVRPPSLDPEGPTPRIQPQDPTIPPGGVFVRTTFGQIFRASREGTTTILWQFTGTNGADPCAELVIGPDGALYGTTSRGGSQGGGNIFRVSAWSFFSVPRVTNGNSVFQITGQPGITYTVESAESLSGPWQKRMNVTAPLSDQGHGIGVVEFSELVEGAAPRFYRTVYPAH